MNFFAGEASNLNFHLESKDVEEEERDLLEDDGEKNEEAINSEINSRPHTKKMTR